MAPSTNSVRAAFFDCGRLNAFTPFAIASTPVSADAPDENASQDHEHADRPGACGERVRDGCVRAATGRAAGEARADHCVEPEDEPVRRDREEDPGFLDAAEVHDGDQRDRRERQRDAVRRERRRPPR